MAALLDDQAAAGVVFANSVYELQFAQTIFDPNMFDNHAHSFLKIKILYKLNETKKSAKLIYKINFHKLRNDKKLSC